MESLNNNSKQEAPLKISVVTVCYNAVTTIEETMLSVLNQTYPNVEYIVIDGGSTDGTVDIIKKYADRLAYWTSEPDKGIYDAMNKGIDAATGDYINFMNAGDTFCEYTNIDNIQKCLVNNIIPAVIYGGVIKRSIDGLLSLEKPYPFFFQTGIIKSPGICHQSTFIRSTLLKHYKFNTEFQIAADYFLLKTLFEEGKDFLEVDFPISIYDTSGISSIDDWARLREFAKINGLSTESLKFNYYVSLYKIKKKIRRVIKYATKSKCYYTCL